MDGVEDMVIDRVDDLVCVSEGVRDDDGDCVCVGVDVGLHASLLARSHMLLYAAPSVTHVDPSLLMNVPLATAKPDTGTWLTTLSMGACQLKSTSATTTTEKKRPCDASIVTPCDCKSNV